MFIFYYRLKKSIDLTIKKEININCWNNREKRNKILKYNDYIQNNSLFGNEKLILNHKCLHESIPQLLIKENSILRKLKHKNGCKEENGSAFYCFVCKKEWSSALCHWTGLVVK